MPTPTKTKPKDLIIRLVTYLKRCDKSYYNNKPIISDADYDKLRDKLVNLDPQNTYLTSVGAPTSGRSKIKHKSLIGSLNKCKTKEEFLDWASDKGNEFCLTEKYDGSTVVARYEDGKLVSLATRGNGQVGEDITDNASRIGVPEWLPKNEEGWDFTGEIRGEAILKLRKFNKYFVPAGYRNARNAANGKVRDLKDDPLIDHIEVMWFDITPEHWHLEWEEDKWRMIGQLLDFDPDDQFAIMTAEQTWESFERYRDKIRDTLDHEIDGLVVKINSIELQESFGVRSNRPKGAIAIKFPAEEKSSYLIGIEWNRGLTGIIAPTGVLKPVDIGGVTIQRVSLCGIDEIERLDVAVGDEVLVSRRNDVIPKIERVLDRAPTKQVCKNLACNASFIAEDLKTCKACSGPLKLVVRLKSRPPFKCRDCASDLVKNKAYIICANLECQGEIYGSIMTWIQRLNIKGIGQSALRDLISHGVTDVAKLYEADLELFERASRSKKLGAKHYKVVQDSKTVRLGVMLSALCIPSLGRTNGTRLEKEFKRLSRVLSATMDEFSQIRGIKTNAKKIHDGLGRKYDLIVKLCKVLTIKDMDTSGPLAGVSICITGDLSKPRPKIQEWVRDNGGEIKTGVGRELTYLVTNSPSSGTGKNKKADKYGISKITEVDLYKMVGSKP